MSLHHPRSKRILDEPVYVHATHWRMVGLHRPERHGIEAAYVQRDILCAHAVERGWARRVPRTVGVARAEREVAAATTCGAAQDAVCQI